MKQLIRKYFLVGALLIGASTQAATVGLTAITVNGDKMVNDSVLGVTWADVAPTNPVDLTGAYNWVSSLNSSNYGGYSDWSLPSGNGSIVPDRNTCVPGTQAQLNCLFMFEFRYKYYETLTLNVSPFTTIDDTKTYWSSSSGGVGYSNWYYFSCGGIGCGGSTIYGSLRSSLAVRTGLTEVAPVPVPASAWLLLSGLGGLGLMRRKRKTLGG